MSDDDPKFPRCKKCGHAWHGLACEGVMDGAYGSYRCACPGLD